MRGLRRRECRCWPACFPPETVRLVLPENSCEKLSDEAVHLAGKQVPADLSKDVVLQVKLPKARDSFQSSLLHHSQHVVVEVELGEGNVMLESLVGDSGEEIMAEPELVQLLQWLESIVGDLIEDIMLEVEATNLGTPLENRQTHGEQVIEAEIY